MMMQRTLDAYVRTLPKFQCVFCNKMCMSGLDLASHVQTHAFNKCDQCPAIFMSSKERNIHAELHTVVKKRSAPETLNMFQCEQCNQNNLDANDTKCAKKWICELCDNMEFSRKDNLRRHIANKHGLRCRHCNVACTTPESRRDHEGLHRQDDYGFSFTCTAVARCLVRCATQEQLVFHMKTNNTSPSDLLATSTITAAIETEVRPPQFYFIDNFAEDNVFEQSTRSFT